MLEKYSVENFKSFKNKTEVDLKQTNYKLLQDSNTENDLRKSILFVGANASEKSNRVLALKVLLDLLFGKNDVNLNKYCCFFTKNNTMNTEYSFVIENVKIIYNIGFQRKDNLLIEKLIVDEKEVLNRLGSTAHSEITEMREYEELPENILILRNIWFNTKFRGFPILQKWFEFLSNSI